LSVEQREVERWKGRRPVIRDSPPPDETWENETWENETWEDETWEAERLMALPEM
jgi:hypothetical protein